MVQKGSDRAFLTRIHVYLGDRVISHANLHDRNRGMVFLQKCCSTETAQLDNDVSSRANGIVDLWVKYRLFSITIACPISCPNAGRELVLRTTIVHRNDPR